MGTPKVLDVTPKARQHEGGRRRPPIRDRIGGASQPAAAGGREHWKRVFVFTPPGCCSGTLAIGLMLPWDLNLDSSPADQAAQNCVRGNGKLRMPNKQKLTHAICHKQSRGRLSHQHIEGIPNSGPCLTNSNRGETLRLIDRGCRRNAQ